MELAQRQIILGGKVTRQERLNFEVTKRLFNAISNGHRNSKSRSFVYLLEEHVESPLVTTEEMRMHEIACDYALSVVFPVVKRGHGPHIQITKVFGWVSDVPGSSNASPGTRTINLLVSSISVIKSDVAREANTHYIRYFRMLKRS